MYLESFILSIRGTITRYLKVNVFSILSKRSGYLKNLIDNKNLEEISTSKKLVELQHQRSIVILKVRELYMVLLYDHTIENMKGKVYVFTEKSSKVDVSHYVEHLSYFIDNKNRAMCRENFRDCWVSLQLIYYFIPLTLSYKNFFHSLNYSLSHLFFIFPMLNYIFLIFLKGNNISKHKI